MPSSHRLSTRNEYSQCVRDLDQPLQRYQKSDLQKGLKIVGVGSVSLISWLLCMNMFMVFARWFTLTAHSVQSSVKKLDKHVGKAQKGVWQMFLPSHSVASHL